MKVVHGSWEWVEKETRDWLEARSTADAHFAWHRYPDSKAARNAIGPQPADFLVGHSGIASHLEVKRTDQKLRLPRSKIGQYGKLLMFHMAGFHTVVLVYRAVFGDWVYLSASELFPEETPVSFSINGNHHAFPTAAAALEDIFG